MASRFDPPPCPRWCQGHPDGDGWLYRPAAATKTCTRVVEAVNDCDGQPVVVVVERFAAIEFGRVVVAEAVFRVQCSAALEASAITSLADTLTRLGELVNEPASAAA